MGFDPIPREPGDVAWAMGSHELGRHVSRITNNVQVIRIFSFILKILSMIPMISVWWSEQPPPKTLSLKVEFDTEDPSIVLE